MDFLSITVLTVSCVVFVYIMYFFIDNITKSHKDE